MQATPLPVAIFRRRFVDGYWILETAGQPELAGVSGGMDGKNPSFTNDWGVVGRFFCVFQCETHREPISIAVSAPSDTVNTTNEVSFAEYSWQQPMTRDVSIACRVATGEEYGHQTHRGDFSIDAETHVTRNLMPHSHVSFNWLVELDPDEFSSLNIVTDADPEWTLMVWRMLPQGMISQAIEDREVAKSHIFPFDNGTWRMERLSEASEWIYWYRLVNVSEPTTFFYQWIWLNAVTNFYVQYPHRIRWWVRRSSTADPLTWDSTSFRLQVLQNLSPIYSETIDVPADTDVITGSFPIPAGTFASGQALRVRTDQLDAGKQFEFAVKLETDH